MFSFFPVVIATLASMLVGFVWYAPSVFGPLWMELSGISKERLKKQGAQGAHIASALAALVFAYILQNVLKLVDVRSLPEAWTLATKLWLGLIVTTQVIHGFFDPRDKRLILLSIGHELANILSMTTILYLLS